MCRLVLIAFAATLLGGSASAATVDPEKLVLRKADVPAGFRFDRAESGVRSNALETKVNPELRPRFARWGRLTGYEAVFERGNELAVINSRADVFRLPTGARSLLLWIDRELIKVSPIALERATVRIGAGGWVYSAPGVTVVVWRSGRVFGGVSGEGVTKTRTLALARAQQRRIAAARS